MIYLRLAGGLGNQLFQIAAASLLANLTSSSVAALTEGLKNYDVPREPDSIKILRPNNWLKTNMANTSTTVRMLALKARAGRWMPIVGINDNTFWKISRKRPLKLHCIMDGYFQRGWTLSAFETAILGMPVNNISQEAASRVTPDEVIVHIRGGDFLRLRNFQVIDFSFYIFAIRLAMQRGFSKFAVITDDVNYAKEVCRQICHSLPSAKLRLLRQTSSTLIDFDTIRNASARIVGNSTFAWWATALGAPSSITWAPTKFARSTLRDFFLPNEIPIQVFES